jgi:small-conductance mechanosensitive channel
MWKDWLDKIPIPGLETLAVAVLVALVSFLGARYLTRIAERLTRPFVFSHELLCRVAAPLHLLIPLLALQAVWSSAPSDLVFMKGARQITSLATIAAFTWLGMRAVDAVQQIILLQHPVNVSDNREARRIQTQTRVLVRTLSFIVLLFGAASMLMTIPAARQFGTSLLASAGVAGIAIGFAAKPVLGNLIAGLQIALTQPISLDDVVIVENEWGRVEEITGGYVVVRIWDDRRLIVPLQWFIENPFQNWTRMNSSLTGAVMLWVDYAIPLEPLRNELTRLCKAASESQLWDGRVSVLQVTDCNERAIQLRVLVSAADSSRNWDLRCYIRENLIAFIQKSYPHCLPQLRAVMIEGSESGPTSASSSTSTQSGAHPEQQPPV